MISRYILLYFVLGSVGKENLIMHDENNKINTKTKIPWSLSL